MKFLFSARQAALHKKIIRFNNKQVRLMLLTFTKFNLKLKEMLLKLYFIFNGTLLRHCQSKRPEEKPKNSEFYLKKWKLPEL